MVYEIFVIRTYLCSCKYIVFARKYKTDVFGGIHREENRDKAHSAELPFIPAMRVKTPARANPENTVIHEYLDDSHSARLSRVPLFMDVTQRQPSYS